MQIAGMIFQTRSRKQERNQKQEETCLVM
ncbi:MULTISPECIES: DUF6783 domain-containing protein [unclassified Blautia]